MPFKCIFRLTVIMFVAKVCLLWLLNAQPGSPVEIPNFIQFPTSKVGQFMGFFAGIALPLEPPLDKLVFSIFLSAGYLVPGNETALEYPPVVPRRMLYQLLELKLQAHGYRKNCLLAGICEAAVATFKHSGVLGDLLHVLLTPSSSTNDGVERRYQRAEEWGLRHGECARYRAQCGASVLDLISLTTPYKLAEWYHRWCLEKAPNRGTWFYTITALATTDQRMSWPLVQCLELVLLAQSTGLEFPFAHNGPYMAIFLDVVLPLERPDQSTVFALALAASYDLPTNSTGPDSGRAWTRALFYNLLERKIEAHGFGPQCLLRAVCEHGLSPLEHHSGVLGDLLHVVLTPSSSREKDLGAYRAAERRGRVGRSCRRYAKACGRSLLELITALF